MNLSLLVTLVAALLLPVAESCSAVGSAPGFAARKKIRYAPRVYDYCNDSNGDTNDDSIDKTKLKLNTNNYNDHDNNSTTAGSIPDHDISDCGGDNDDNNLGSSNSSSSCNSNISTNRSGSDGSGAVDFKVSGALVRCCWIRCWT